jgi:hypothetical protein
VALRGGDDDQVRAVAVGEQAGHPQQRCQAPGAGAQDRLVAAGGAAQRLADERADRRAVGVDVQCRLLGPPAHEAGDPFQGTEPAVPRLQRPRWHELGAHGAVSI